MTVFTSIKDFPLWQTCKKRIPFGFDIDITARCNFNCRHCCINLSQNDTAALATELTHDEILEIGRQAVELGALWCLLSGGEPLLRSDFEQIYLGLKRLGLLVSVYTNASLVGDQHLALFKKYPPRDIEVTMYGASAETYERVTRRSGSLAAFKRGIERLISGGIKVRLKAMALRSNFHELDDIASFCRKHTKDYYRFDPLLHLRLDRNEHRNKEIMSERLTPMEIVTLERADPERSVAMDNHCDHYIDPEREQILYDDCSICHDREGCERYEQFTRLLYCGAGQAGFSVSYDGKFRLCQSLNSPGTTYDLRNGTLREAWEKFVPQVRSMRTFSQALLSGCKSCSIVNLCLNCPAHAWLESGDGENVIRYFCDVAHARKLALQKTTR